MGGVWLSSLGRTRTYRIRYLTISEPDLSRYVYLPCVGNVRRRFSLYSGSLRFERMELKSNTFKSFRRKWVRVTPTPDERELIAKATRKLFLD